MRYLKNAVFSIPYFLGVVYAWFGLSSFMKRHGNPYHGRSILAIAGQEREAIRLEDLLTLERDQLIGIFHQLPAPALDEMRGEYKAVCLDCGGTLRQMLSDLCLHRIWGKWQNKAFEPLDARRGHGYNSFRASRASGREDVLPALGHACARMALDYLLGKDDPVMVRLLRMRTRIGDSIYDARTSFHLDYGADTPFPVSTMRDEVRKLNDTLFLGLGILGISFGRRNIFPFVLVGPPEAWVGSDMENAGKP